jgi:DNA-binding response OmpR family regulator
MSKGCKTIKNKILIVEDEIVQAMFLGKILELWDIEICEIATSGEEAVKEAEIQKPDLVLMDISIHGKISGIEAAGRIRSRLGIPVIFLSGHSDEETRLKAYDARPAGYFVKPLDYNKLEEAIMLILHQKK